MHTSHRSSLPDNVVPLFKRGRPGHAPALHRVSPECDGLELLYANDNQPDKLFALKILCWALRHDGDVVAMVPWLNRVVAADDLEDPLNGHWEGYRLPEADEFFTAAPCYKADELKSAVAFFGKPTPVIDVMQEIPDTIGTHVVFSDDEFQTINLVEVVSWRLTGDGELQAMVADEDEVTRTPVLPGDPCLVPAQDQEGFRYFFQHGIANRIKERDPEALAAIALLVGEPL